MHYYFVTKVVLRDFCFAITVIILGLQNDYIKVYVYIFTFISNLITTNPI